jgi:hypothetical protein
MQLVLEGLNAEMMKLIHARNNCLDGQFWDSRARLLAAHDCRMHSEKTEAEDRSVWLRGACRSARRKIGASMRFLRFNPRSASFLCNGYATRGLWYLSEAEGAISRKVLCGSSNCSRDACDSTTSTIVLCSRADSTPVCTP